MLKDKFVKNHIFELRKLLIETKVVYTDLDNTLLGPRSSLFTMPDHTYSIKPALSMLQLMEKGIDIVLISGRNAAQLREIVRLLGLKNFVSELGCLIFYDQGKEIIENFDYPVPEGKTLFQAVDDGGAPALLLERFKNRLEYHTPWSESQTCTHLFRGSIDVDEANNVLIEAGFDDLRVVDNGGSRARSTASSGSELRVYHLLPRGANKASAIALDRQKRGISVEQTIALGDSLADLEMAEAVSAFFLVADGVSESPELSKSLLVRENAFLTSEKMGLGWAEVADLLLS